MKKYFLRIVLALFLVFSFTVNANAVVAVRGATTITGGASGSLDSFDGATLNDGDICFVFYGTSFYFYKLDATSGAVESSPTTISPDTNAGNKRWILQNTTVSGFSADTVSEATAAAGVTIDSLKIKDAGFAIGSDADGDTYYRDSGALARLAKGTAYQYKRMNSGATVPEWADGETVLTDYGGTSTVVGWSSFTSKLIYTKKIGKTVFVYFKLSGTSDATSVTFTVPYSSSVGAITNTCWVIDNGTPAIGYAQITTSTVTVYRNPSADNWTNSGNKYVYGQLCFDVS